MRQLLIAAASAAAALTLISCDPPVLEIKDNSALEKVVLQASNDTPKWEYGEERTITIAPSPLAHFSLTDKSVFDIKKSILTSAVSAFVIDEIRLQR